MVERSLVSFVVLMAAMAYVTRPWHVFALRAVQGLFAGYGALALTMAAESAPRGPHGVCDRHRADGAAARAGARAGDRRRRRPDGRPAQRVPRDVGLLRRGARARVLHLRRARTAGRAGLPTASGRDPLPNVLAFENFILLMAVDLRAAVRRSQLRTGPAALRRASSERRRDRVPFVAGCSSRSPPAPGRSAISSAHGCCAGGRRGRHGWRRRSRAPSARRCSPHAARTARDCSSRRRFFGLAHGCRDDRRLHGREQRDPGERARRRVRAAHDRVAGRAGAEPDRHRLLGATSIRAVFVLDVVIVLVIARRGLASHGRRAPSAATAAPAGRRKSDALVNAVDPLERPIRPALAAAVGGAAPRRRRRLSDRHALRPRRRSAQRRRRWSGCSTSRGATRRRRLR